MILLEKGKQMQTHLCSSSVSNNSSTSDQLQKMKAELEKHFSALRQDLMSEFRGAIQEVIGLIPKEMVSPQSSTHMFHHQIQHCVLMSQVWNFNQFN